MNALGGIRVRSWLSAAAGAGPESDRSNSSGRGRPCFAHRWHTRSRRERPRNKLRCGEMAEERQAVPVSWERAADFRLSQPSGGSATAVDFGQGPMVLLHLTTNTVVLKGETVPSVVDTTRGL